MWTDYVVMSELQKGSFGGAYGITGKDWRCLRHLRTIGENGTSLARTSRNA